jgi:transposase-like protein
MTGRRYTTEEIIKSLRSTNGLVSLAARQLGCTTQTIYLRARNTASVQQAIEDSRAELVDHAELALRAAILGRESWAVALTLRTLGRNRGYVERQEVTGSGGGPIEIALKWDNADPDDNPAETA